MIRVSHPTGNANVRGLVEGLYRNNLLDSFYTTIGIGNDNTALAWLPDRVALRIQRRAYCIPKHLIRTHPLKELIRHCVSATSSHLVKNCKGFSIDAVYRDLDRFVARSVRCGARKGLEGVYCYEDGAEDTFRAARELGLMCIYDLPIAYWETSRRLLREEAERLPEWEPTLVGTRDSQEKLDRKSYELGAADVVVIPSKFVYESIPEGIRKAKPCVIAKFGSPYQDIPQKRRETRNKLRVIFAGSMTQRKGLADVFAAMHLLKRRDVELIVIGAPILSIAFYRSQLSEFTHIPPCSHGKMLEAMAGCDVLVLPSIVEGRALVQQEAMMCGLPIIITRNAGGEDLVNDGETGFVVPIRSPSKIAESIAWCADHKEEVHKMGAAAKRFAKSYTWESYVNTITAAFRG